MKLKTVVRERLEKLATYVENHGEGVLRGVDQYAIFNLSQAETYCRFYQGYKREAQEQSIESDLIDPNDPLYGWGWLAQHDPSPRAIGPVRQSGIKYKGQDIQRISLEEKRLQPAELVVVRRPLIIPTLAMWIVRATVGPVTIPEFSQGAILSRIKKLAQQTDSPGLLEKINRLYCIPTPEGIRIHMAENDLFEVGPIRQ